MTEENLLLALRLLPLQLWNTCYMVVTSAFFACVIGFPLGIFLVLTGRGHLKENVWVYKTLETVVNIGRSFPFAILMVALIPFTRWIIGTSLGTTASIVPLSLAAAPFIARLIEANLSAVEKPMVEAALVMGSTVSQIVRKILLPEALPALISSVTLLIVNLVGYSAMAGLVGGGGLGQVAIQYGYQRFNGFIMLVTVVLLILLVQSVQWLGSRIIRFVQQQRGGER